MKGKKNYPYMEITSKVLPLTENIRSRHDASIRTRGVSIRFSSDRPKNSHDIKRLRPPRGA